MQYYRVGISGHRDLKQEKIPDYLERMKEVLKNTVKDHSDKEVLAVSPLADGADRLLVKAAKELNIRYEVMLPMDSKLYIKDFDDASYLEYNSMLFNARKCIIMPLCENNTESLISEYGSSRDKQYQALGKSLVDTCDAVIFLYDGIDNAKVGGTADIFNYAKSVGKKSHLITCERENNLNKERKIMTDVEKFAVIIAKYPEIYGGYQSFSERIGAGKSAVYNWERAEGKSINKKFRDRICEAFSLSYSVWDDNSSDKHCFFDNLPTHELLSHEIIR